MWETRREMTKKNQGKKNREEYLGQPPGRMPLQSQSDRADLVFLLRSFIITTTIR